MILINVAGVGSLVGFGEPGRRRRGCSRRFHFLCGAAPSLARFLFPGALVAQGPIIELGFLVVDGHSVVKLEKLPAKKFDVALFAG